jgi:glycosyltransferase involved in cell wall biosynthesis
MKVLLASHAYTAPGGQHKLHSLSAAAKMRLTVITPMRWRDVLFTVSPQNKNTPSYRHLTLPTHFDGKVNRFFYRANLSKLLRDIAPDILHIEQEPHSLVAAQFAWAKPRHARGVIFTWENIDQPIHPIQRLIRKFVLSKMDFVIGGNDEATQVMKRAGWRGATAVIPQLGVEIFEQNKIAQLRRQRRAEWNLGNDIFVVGYIGRLIEEKGLLDLVAAISQLEGSHFVALGEGRLKQQLQSNTQTMVLSAVPHDDVPSILSAMDVLVLPSRTTPRWKEQFGHVLIEAMACGVPVIGSDSGAISEVIGEAGLVFPEGDVEALRAGLIRLRDNVSLRNKFGELGLRRVQEKYTHARIAQQTLDVYRHLLT